MKPRKGSISATLPLAALLAAAFGSVRADADSSAGCRAIELVHDSSDSPALELPNGETIDWAASFDARLAGLLTTDGRFRVITESASRGLGARLRRTARAGSGLQWTSSQNASVVLHLDFPEVSFRTGSRGDRMTYGWTSRVKPPSESNPYRDPATDFGAAAFSPRDPGILGTYAGLDLGEGFSLDLLFAWLRIRLARYEARVALDLGASLPAAGEESSIPIRSRARGFFFDVSGGYLGYQAGLEASRSDAMKRALDRAVESVAGEIERRFADAPRVARIDGWTLSSDGGTGEVLLASASGCPLPQGLRLASPDGSVVIEVRESHENGGIGAVIAGKPEATSPGLLLHEGNFNATTVRSALAARRITSIGSTTPVTLESPEEFLPRPDELLRESGVVEKSAAEISLERLAGLLLLPYRIYRYFEHDQAYHRDSDPVVRKDRPWSNIENWERAARESDWGRKLHLASLEDRSEGAVVAVVDTGVDYNQPVLHERLWINPAPEPDAFGEVDRYGWDFVSDDRRADDDHDRGTELASLVLAVAPHARILPVKVFNPWGVTRADLLAAGIRYAARKGATVILTAWEPETASRDLDEAIEEARRAGARIIAPGDSGLPLSDDDAFLALRPRLRHGFIAGPSARAAILAGLTARGE